MGMTLVSTVVVGATTNSIQFTNIPQTGKKLLAVASTRNNSASASADLALFVNDVVTTSYNQIRLRGTGTGVAAAQVTGDTRISYPQGVGGGQTANTFSNNLFLFPNYTSSNHKQIIIDSVSEGNSSNTQQLIIQGYINTTAITKLEFADISGNVFVQYTSVSLYIVS